MKTFKVTIRAIVYKTLIVEADDEDAAYDAAHEEFDVTSVDDRDGYEEETLSVEEVRT